MLPGSRIGAALGLYGLTCLLLVIGLDTAVQFVIDRVRERALVVRAADDKQLESELSVLKADSDGLEAQVLAQASRRIPTVDELKQLSVVHNLRLTRMERQSSSAAGADHVPVRYVTTFRGSTLNIVRFLRDLEERYLCAADRVELWPADQGGAEVAVQLSLGVREP